MLRALYLPFTTLVVLSVCVASYGEPSSTPSCSQEELMSCARHLQLNSTEAFSIEYISKVCSQTVPITRACIEVVRPMCSESYPLLPDTFVAILDFVCTNQGKRGMLKHYDCLHWNYFVICDRQVATDDPEVACRSLESMVDCIRTRADLICGTDAGGWIDGLLRHALNSGYAGDMKCNLSGAAGNRTAAIVVGVVLIGGFLIAVIVIVALRLCRHGDKYRTQVPQTEM